MVTRGAIDGGPVLPSGYRMWFFKRPPAAVTDAFLDRQRHLPWSYTGAGATRGQDWPAGYNHDRNEIELGCGEAVFQRGVAALRAWRMFPAGWTIILPEKSPQTEGTAVALLIRVFGIWWLNAARVVYEVDERGEGVKRRIGFAYGTLPGHVEGGEERFTVAWKDDDRVVYELYAYSRPRLWLVRLTKPVARMLQRRFVKQSLSTMRRLANPEGKP